MDSSNLNEYQLIKIAQEQASDQYKVGNDFAFGFTTGLFLNVFAATPDLVYVIVNSEQEKNIQEEISTDSSYTNVNKEKLRRKTKNKIKGKKLLATAGGTAVGSLVQIIAFVAILTAF